jgi:desulfoferrodoxin (superoxide reductase-like protein)
VDEEKVKAAVKLGILSAEILTDYKDRKHIPVIAVKER